MLIQFDKLSVVCFRSIVEPLEIHIPENPGLIFVDGWNALESELGSNGAGKSSVFLALQWGLYGKTSSGLRRGDIKSWNGGNGTEVIVSLRRDGEPHEICRTASHLLINGEEAAQEQVDELIGMPFDVFCHTVAHMQGQPLFFDLRPAEKMAMLAPALDVERWERRSKHARAEATRLSNAAAIMANELNVYGRSINEVERDIKTHEEKAAEFENARDERESETKAEVRRLRAQHVTLDDRRVEYDLSLERAATEIAPLRRDIAAIEHDASELRTLLQSLQAVAQEKRRRASAELKTLGDGKTCPLCRQSAKGSHLERHRKKLEADLNAVEDPSGAESAEKIDAFAERASELREKLAEFEMLKSTSEQNLMAVNRELAVVDARIREMERGLAETTQQHNPFTQHTQILRKRLKDTKAVLVTKTAEKSKLERQAIRREFWIEGFRVIRLQIIEEVLAELQMATNAVLAEIGLARWRVEYTIARETQAGNVSHGFNVWIRSPRNDAPVKWEAWSGGEGQRLRIAGALALSDVLLARYGVECDLRIFDEPSTWMAGEGIQDVIDLLADRAADRDQRIYFIDHRVDQSARFSSTIRLVKDERGTYIE